MRPWAWLALACAVAGFDPEPALAQPFSITQITDSLGFGSHPGVPTGDPSIDGSGRRIAFVSLLDLTPGSPGNADGSGEIYLFAAGVLTQVTSSPKDSFQPSISASGNRIAFVSLGDLTPGSPGNADGNLEIFLYDVATGVFTQITNTTGGGGNLSPSINAAGTRIAFTSDRDLAPGSPGNADGNFEIFLFDTTTGVFTQITNTTGASSSAPGNAEPSIDAAGTRIAFKSDRNLTPGSPGNADANFEIFLFDTITGVFRQVTSTTGGANAAPSLSGTGSRIAFVSDRNLTPGSPGNVDGNAEIFLFDTTTGLFTQVTNTTGAGTNAGPSINATGTRIAFSSSHDLAPGQPGNADGNEELFMFETPPGVIVQITSTTGFGVTNSASIDAAGVRIAFVSTHDLAPGQPGNADGDFEIFLAATAEATAIPALSTALQIALAALLLLAGLRTLHRRGI